MWWHRIWQREREQWCSQAQGLTFSKTSGDALKELLEHTTKRVTALHSSELSLKGRAATMGGIFTVLAIGIIGFMAKQPSSPDNGATLRLVGPAILAVIGLFLGAVMCFRAGIPTYGVEPGVLPFEFEGEDAEELRRRILKVYATDIARGLQIQNRRIGHVWLGSALGLGAVVVSALWLMFLL